jgi:hypothetical protein
MESHGEKRYVKTSLDSKKEDENRTPTTYMIHLKVTAISRR